MTSIGKILTEVKELPYSQIGKEMTIEDACIIWKSVGHFLYDNIKQGRSVVLPTIGKFSVEDVRIPIAHNPSRYVCRRTPAFHISSQLASHFRIKYKARYLGGNQPEVSVNKSAIAYYCGRPRFEVDVCIKEVGSFVYRRLASNSPVKLLLSKVGTLIMQDNKYRFEFQNRFLREFQVVDEIREYE